MARGVNGGNDRLFGAGELVGDGRILDFRQGEDRLHLSGVTPADVRISVLGNDMVLTTLSDQSVTLVGFTGMLTYGTDVIFS